MADPIGYFKQGADVYANLGGGQTQKIDQPTFQNLGLNANLLGEGLTQTKPLDQLRDTETKSFVSAGGTLGKPQAAISAGFLADGAIPSGGIGGPTDPTKTADSLVLNNLMNGLATAVTNQTTLAKNYSDAQLKTPEQIQAEKDLLNLQQEQEKAVQTAQERPLTGTILKGGLDAEINAINSGSTVDSLKNLREQTFQIQKLNLLQGTQTQKIAAAKVLMDANQVGFDNAYKLIQSFSPQNAGTITAANGDVTMLLRNPITGVVTAQSVGNFGSSKADTQLTTVNGHKVLINSQTGAVVKDLGLDTTGGTEADKTKIAISDMAKQLAGVAGTDGFVDPKDYQKALNAWVGKGYPASTFHTNFANFRNPNDSGYNTGKAATLDFNSL